MPSFLECDNCLQTGTFVDANIPYTKTKFIFNTFPSHLDGWFFFMKWETATSIKGYCKL